MATWQIVLIVITVLLLAATIALYIVGKKSQKKKEEQDAQIAVFFFLAGVGGIQRHNGVERLRIKRERGIILALCALADPLVPEEQFESNGHKDKSDQGKQDNLKIDPHFFLFAGGLSGR